MIREVCPITGNIFFVDETPEENAERKRREKEAHAVVGRMVIERDQLVGLRGSVDLLIKDYPPYRQYVLLQTGNGRTRLYPVRENLENIKQTT